MAQEIPNFKQLKTDLIEAFNMAEPDWLIKENPTHHSAGFGIFTNQTLTVTMIHFIEVHGYQLRHIKPAGSLNSEESLHAFFVEAEL